MVGWWNILFVCIFVFFLKLENFLRIEILVKFVGIEIKNEGLFFYCLYVFEVGVWLWLVLFKNKDVWVVYVS